MPFIYRHQFRCSNYHNVDCFHTVIAFSHMFTMQSSLSCIHVTTGGHVAKTTGSIVYNVAQDFSTPELDPF